MHQSTMHGDEWEEEEEEEVEEEEEEEEKDFDWGLATPVGQGCGYCWTHLLRSLGVCFLDHLCSRRRCHLPS